MCTPGPKYCRIQKWQNIQCVWLRSHLCYFRLLFPHSSVDSIWWAVKEIQQIEHLCGTGTGHLCPVKLCYANTLFWTERKLCRQLLNKMLHGREMTTDSYLDVSSPCTNCCCCLLWISVYSTWKSRVLCRKQAGCYAFLPLTHDKLLGIFQLRVFVDCW